MTQPQVKHVTVSQNDVDQRIDNFLTKTLKGVPKSRIYRLLRTGEVRVNKSRIKPSYRLQLHDIIRIPPVRTAAEKAPAKLKVETEVLLVNSFLYEDEHLLVINKPAYMPVHAGTGLYHGLIDYLRLLRKDLEYVELVHRLDRETSGCLIIAKTRASLQYLHQQMRAGTIQKSYLALVLGHPNPAIKEINKPLLKNVMQSGERMVCVDADGKPALTQLKITKSYAHTTLVTAMPITGRTHQIRVHLTSIGHPLAGDSKYGDKSFNKEMHTLGLERLFLHASDIVIPTANGSIPISVHCPLAPDLQQVLANIAEK